MKGIIVFTLMAMMSLSISSQVKFGNGALGDYDAQIRVVTEDNSIYLLMTFRDYDNKFVDTPKFLIKLFDDTVMELQGTNLSSSTDDNGAVIVSGVVIPFDLNVCNLKFPITLEQIESLKKGVKKVRLNTSPKYREKEWHKDKIGKAIYKEYEHSSSNSFRDKF
jgi:hypothetical protein